MKRIISYIFHRDHLIITISAFLQLWLLGVIAINLDFLNPIATALDDFSITDVFFDIQQNSNPEYSDIITLVDITDLYERGEIANVICEIDESDPICIGVDVIFEGVKDDKVGNEILEGVIEGLNSNSVFSKKLIDYDTSRDMFTDDVKSYFSDIFKITEAYTNLNNDMSEARVRDFSIRQCINDSIILSFPAKIASLIDGRIEGMQDNDYIINYRNISFQIIPYDSLFNNTELISNHIVLLGTTREERDMHNTPLGKMSGLEIHAYSILTLLEHRDIWELPTWLSFVIAFILCYILELVIDISNHYLIRNNKTPFFVFLKESNMVTIVILFFWVAFLCWIMYILFIKYNVYLSGGIILGLLALICEGRDLYIATIKALQSKYESSSFIKNSLMSD